MPHVDLLVRVLPILGFLVCITVVAELSDRWGVFSVLASGAARVARGSVLLLWLLVVAIATVATAVLSLDTTAVLLTPVVLALASRLELDRRLFAYTTVWLANTASLFLPVSNLTNLLALHKLAALGVPADARGFVGLLWPAAGCSWLVTVIALVVVFRRSLRGRYTPPGPAAVGHRGLLVLAMIVCGLLGPLLLLGLSPLVASAAGALTLVIGALVADRSPLSWRLLPWPLVLGVFVLFVLVQVANDLGLATWLTQVAGRQDALVDLLRLTGLGALASNVLNNLPSYLALEPVGSSPLRLAALLVGVNAGPLVTPWASVATLLWAARCRAAGVSVDWRRFGLLGLALVLPLLTASTLALWFFG